MKNFAYAACIAAVMMATPVWAQSYTGIFTEKGDRVAADLAKIRFPKKVGPVSLNTTFEFSRKGEALDTAAEYTGPGDIRATLYLYRPGYPDAALAAFETDRVMPRLYGSATTRTGQTVVALGGRVGTAIRITYKGAVRDGAPLSTVSAFARIGGWVFKLRVSAPGADRQAEVEGILDAFLATAELDKDAFLPPVAPLDFAASCPAAPSGQAMAMKSDDAATDAFGAAIMAMPLDPSDNKKRKKDDKPLPLPFPQNGLTKVCSRGLLPNSTLEVLQPASEAKPSQILVMLSDSGDVAMVSKSLLGKGYSITRSKVATLMVLGGIDRMPDNAELARIFGGGIPGVLDTRVTVTQKASGDSTININPAFMK